MRGLSFLSRGGLSCGFASGYKTRMAANTLDLRPDKQALEHIDFETFRHIIHVHFYLEQHGITLRPEQDLHDKDKVTNQGIKEALALEYCRGREGYVDCDEPIEQAIRQAVEQHRADSYHHQIWVGALADPRDDDYSEGAVDIICTIMERRPYFERMGLAACSLEEIAANPSAYIKSLSNGDTVDKLPYVEESLQWMLEMKKPQLWQLKSLRNLPNIGLSTQLYERIINLRDMELIALRPT